MKEKFKLMLKKLEGEEIILFSSVIALLWVLSCISSGHQELLITSLFRLYIIWSVLGLIGIAFHSFTEKFKGNILYRLITPLKETPETFKSPLVKG